MPHAVPTSDVAADLRAEVARRQVQIYRLAALVGLHPSHLGQILRGRRPLSVDLAERISVVLGEVGADPTASTQEANDGRPA